MKYILIALICFLFPISLFAQSIRVTDPKGVKRFERREKRYKRQVERDKYLMYNSVSSIWSWQSKIEIDSLDFINPQSHLLSKSDKVHSIL